MKLHEYIKELEDCEKQIYILKTAIKYFGHSPDVSFITDILYVELSKRDALQNNLRVMEVLENGNIFKSITTSE